MKTREYGALTKVLSKYDSNFKEIPRNQKSEEVLSSFNLDLEAKYLAKDTATWRAVQAFVLLLAEGKELTSGNRTQGYSWISSSPSKIEKVKSTWR